MADNASQFDPFGDIVNLVAGPVAATIRSVEQLRRAADEIMRGVENFNATMENLNETAARVNRLLNEFEEPARLLVPQLTRTVKAADEITQKLSSLPVDPGEFMRAMMDLSVRLAPVAQMAESATGLLGLRLPGFGRPTPPAPPVADHAVDAAASPPPTPARAPKSAAKKSPAKRAAAKKSPAAAKRSTRSR